LAYLLVDVGLSLAGNGDEDGTTSIMLLAAWLGNSSTGFLPVPPASLDGCSSTTAY
jgi:hypothetical protein